MTNLNRFLEHMLALGEKRYPYWHNVDLINTNLTNFEKANDDFDPICLKGKFWELIKLAFTNYRNNKI